MCSSLNDGEVSEMWFKIKKNSIKIVSYKCQVTKELLADLVDEFGVDPFFVDIGALESSDPLCPFLLEHAHVRIIKTNIRQELRDVVLEMETETFLSMLDLLLECQAEVISFCFPNANKPDAWTSFEQFIIGEYGTNGIDAVSIISQGSCWCAISWVTNNYELFFHYDAKVAHSSIKKHIKQMLGV
jgi:hypothetical protein